MITVSVTGVDGAQQTLAKIVPQSTKAVRELAQRIHDLADAGADKHTKTGALRRSLYLRSIPGGWEIGHDRQMAPHAVFVHWGTKPHVIKGKPVTPYKVYPKPPNKVLGGIFRRWYVKKQKTLRWSVGGKFIFANEVHHPGYKGDPWLIRAADQAVREFDRIVNNAFSK
jgi:hypothetical protein